MFDKCVVDQIDLIVLPIEHGICAYNVLKNHNLDINLPYFIDE